MALLMVVVMVLVMVRVVVVVMVLTDDVNHYYDYGIMMTLGVGIMYGMLVTPHAAGVLKARAIVATGR